MMRMTRESFIQYMMHERDAVHYDEGELATIISILDRWVAVKRVRRIVNPTTRPRRILETFDVPTMTRLRNRAVVAFNNKS